MSEFKPNRLVQLKEQESALQREIERMQEKAKQHGEEIAHTRAKILLKILTPEIISALAPEHDCTSCSDTNISNGGVTTLSQGDKLYLPRCVRCFLLSCHEAKVWPYEYMPSFRIRVSEPWAKNNAL